MNVALIFFERFCRRGVTCLGARYDALGLLAWSKPGNVSFRKVSGTGVSELCSELSICSASQRD